MALNIADLAEHAIDAVPDRVALICGDEQITYAELEEKANRFAHYLIDHGVKKDDKVGLYCRNRIEIVIAMLGIVKAGAVMVNINFRYVEAELRYMFENSDMVALVHERQYSDRVANVLPDTPNVKTVLVVNDGTGGSDEKFQRYGGVEFYEAIAEASPERDFPERSADDIYLLYTGGTTGFPKGVMWRHEDIYRVLLGGTDFATGEYIADEYDLSKQAAAGPPLIRFPIPPMIHGATQSATWGALFTGSTTILAPEFDAGEVWNIIEQRKANLLFFTGDAMGRPLLDALEGTTEDRDLSSLFLLASTAALFSPSLKEKFLELLPNRIITDSIGSSETGFGGSSVVAKGESHASGPRVTIDKNVKVLDDEGNEVKPGSGVRGIIAKSGHIPVGYYKDEKKTAETFRTINGVRYAIPGDYATVEEDGTVTMLGRGSVSINTGGEKVYPEEVEAALKGHPDVFDALVVGVPDARFGNHVAAVVAPREGARPTLAELDAFVRKEIAGYKVPRSLWLVGEVKRSPAGKPDYKWAKEQTEQRPADDVHAKHVGATS
ncbi:acyl-CoA synthetase [Mycolicibacterium sp. CH28]|uniref:acyl-CoA synthetase n=1 Tax=Mycolicibacterium sp. CH28 TaxID=2512237 RepID=UPI0010802D2E|nr:acyl-CoA synthetase [Mycolicibacterium sp. CH28]TGD84080.1 acyl-CoA synthetase [Mycolicibacterium sp. CH28]